MDIQTNEFTEMDDQKEMADPIRYIPFSIEEEVEIKGYRFRIVRIKIGMNELVLKPLGVAKIRKGD